MPVCVTSTCVMSVCVCGVNLCDVSVCVCGVNLYDVKLCDVNLCDVNLCDVDLCDVKLCDVNLCDVNLCDVKLCDVNLCDVNLCGVNLCDVKLCDVNLCDFNLCDVNLCDVNLCDVKLRDVNLCDVKLCDVKLCDVSVRVCDVNLCGVCLCDVNLCDVNLCDFNLCDVNLCDVNLCDVKLCDVNLCDVNLCHVKLCDVSVRVCDVNLCGVCLSDVNLCNANLCAQLPQTQFTHSKAPNPHASKTSTQNFRTSYWHSYPKRNLHTARRQTRTPARHPHKIFAAPIGTATPNAIYTQQGTKPACQQDIDATFSHLLLAQLPRTQFTHSKPPNPHARKTSTQNVRNSYWHSYPERNLHTARRQTRMPAGHQRKIFAAPIGTATPNTIYTQQGAKPACQQHISTEFSQLLLAQLPRTQFTHSKAPNPHGRNTSTQNFRNSYWNSDPKHNLHTARRQTRTPATHPHKIFAPPIGTATPNTIYTQQGAKPECQQHISAKFSQLLLAQLPGTQFTHSKAPNPHASNTSAQNFRSSYWRSYPEHNLHTARRQTPMAGTHQHKIFATPIGTATPNTIYTQQGAKPACQEDINTKCSQLLLEQRPRTQFTHSKAPNPHARKTLTQNVRNSYWNSDPEHNLHTARRQTRMPGRHQHKIFAAPIGTEAATKNVAKAYIRPLADAASPTPATQKSSGQCGGPRTPKRTSDPVQTQQVPRLPRKSPAASAAARAHQSVHQTPCRCSKSHACHAKVQRPARRPAHTKAYIRPRADAANPTPAKAYIRPRAEAASPTPATQKSSGQRGGPRTPKRTSDPVQMQQVPRLPRKSPAASAAARAHQSVHQTLRRRSKSHACHAKVQRPMRRPAHTKAYIRPRADAASPTPATQKSSGQRGGPRTPKRTSDPVQTQQVPRLPRKSPAASAAARAHQSVHQTPCRCSKSHACHAKVQRPARRPAHTKAYIIRPRADAASPTPATQKSNGQRGGPRTPKRTSDPVQMQQVPRLPRKSPAASAAARAHQSVHQTPCRCSKSHACHAKAAAVKLCDVKLCDVKLRDVKLRDVNLRDVNLRDVKQCDVKLCDVCCVVVCVCVLMLLYSVMWCEAMWCEAVWREAVWCVKLCDVKLCDVCIVLLCCCVCWYYCIVWKQEKHRKRGGGVCVWGGEEVPA